VSTPYNDQPEPILVLPNGVAVYQCIYESIVDLQRRGHVVTVVGDDEVCVQPPSLSMNPDWLIVLGRNAAEVAAILALDHGAIH
jgi:hypothetical protein